MSYWADDAAKWLVLEVESAGIVMLDGKCKFERCTIRFVGAMAEATAYIAEHEPRASGVAIIGACKRVGDGEAVLVGSLGKAAAGYKGTATTGKYGTATAGDGGTATAGDGGTATAGRYGAATAGRYGTATAGDDGTATTGEWGTATTGEWGTAQAGKKGELRIRYWDSAAERYRTEIAYVRENGIRPNTAYKLDDYHEFVEVKS